MPESALAFNIAKDAGEPEPPHSSYIQRSETNGLTMNGIEYQNSLHIVSGLVPPHGHV